MLWPKASKEEEAAVLWLAGRRQSACNHRLQQGLPWQGHWCLKGKACSPLLTMLRAQSSWGGKAATQLDGRTACLHSMVIRCTGWGSHCGTSSLSVILVSRCIEDCTTMQTGTLLDRLAERMSDASKEVRTALHALLAEAVLPQLRGAALAPFLPLLMAHLASALTSLDEGVRCSWHLPACDAAAKARQLACLRTVLQHLGL